MSIKKNLPNDQMIFSSEELKNAGLSYYLINNMVEEGKLIKLNKGYYKNTSISKEESEFYYVSAYASSGVICLLSAASYYGLTNYRPSYIDVAIPRKSKARELPNWPIIHISYFTDERHSMGIDVVEQGRNSFRIYDKEKTVVDIVYYREQVGIEETKEVLTNYLKQADRDINKLVRYAKALKCDEVLERYLEMLL